MLSKPSASCFEMADASWSGWAEPLLKGRTMKTKVTSAPRNGSAGEPLSDEQLGAEVLAKRDALASGLNAFQEAIAEARRRHAAAAVLHADMLTLGSRLHNRGMESLAVSPSSVAVEPLTVDLPTLPTVARHLDRTLEAIADYVGSGTRLKSNKRFASKGHLFVNNGLTLNRGRVA